MNGLWLYAYIALPAIVVAMGYAAVRLSEPRPHIHPGE